MRAAIRRLRRLEKKRKNDAVEIWVCFDDGRAQNYSTGEMTRHADLIDSHDGVARMFISEADSRL